MSSLLNSPAPIEDQAKLLDEVLNIVKVQAHLMKKCLVCLKKKEKRNKFFFNNVSIGKQQVNGWFKTLFEYAC